MKKMVLKWFKTREKKFTWAGQKNFMKCGDFFTNFAIMSPVTNYPCYLSNVTSREFFEESDELKFPLIACNAVCFTTEYTFLDRVDYSADIYNEKLGNFKMTSHQYKHQHWATN